MDDAVGKSYIAGPMAGREDHGFPAFHQAEEKLREQGFSEIINPVNNCDEATFKIAESMSAEDFKQTAQYAQLVEKGVRQTLQCVRVFLLPGWEKSTGARLEHDVAKATGRWVYEYKPNGKHKLLHEGTLLALV